MRGEKQEVKRQATDLDKLKAENEEFEKRINLLIKENESIKRTEREREGN